MKSKISFILAMVMILSIIPMTSFAEESHDKQLKEAIIRSKDLFDIGNEYDKFDQSISSMGEETVFYLNWSDSKDQLGNINVSISVDGNIINYWKNQVNHGGEKNKIANINKEEGLKIAKDFIKKISPKLSSNIKYIDDSEVLNINSNEYRYNFVRSENDIPYYSDRVHVSVDNLTGEVIDYSTRWSKNLKFPDTKDIISLEKAKELYKEKIGLDLIYKLGGQDRESKRFLVYGPLDGELGIDAKNGQTAFTYDHYRLYDKAEGMGGSMNESVKDLSPYEEEAIKDISGLVTKKEAEKLAREILKLDGEYKLRNINLHKNWRNDDEYVWEMSFLKETDSRHYISDISINAKSKKLLSFFKGRDFDLDKKPKYNKEDSLKFAKEFIKKVASDNYDEIELRDNLEIDRLLEDKEGYRFNFIRKVDNAYVESEGINIYINAINGDVESYDITWSDKDFPSKDNLISLDKAYDILFKNIGIELKYTSKNIYDIDHTQVNDKNEVILVYALNKEKPSNIDANTGNILNDIGEIYKKPSIIEYKDIENSYAKDKINILAQYGISLSGEKFLPKEKISQKDFLYLLTKAKYPYIEIDDMYRHLSEMKIIKDDEKNPESLVTKEEGILYIIRALGYDKIANLTEIYKDLFTDSEDLNPDLRGHLSIAYGLGIVKAEDKKLAPKAELKREDAADMIYNCLFSVN